MRQILKQDWEYDYLESSDDETSEYEDCAPYFNWFSLYHVSYSDLNDSDCKSFGDF